MRPVPDVRTAAARGRSLYSAAAWLGSAPPTSSPRRLSFVSSTLSPYISWAGGLEARRLADVTRWGATWNTAYMSGSAAMKILFSCCKSSTPRGTVRRAARCSTGRMW